MIIYNLGKFKVAKNKYVNHNELYELKDNPAFIHDVVFKGMPEGCVGLLLNMNKNSLRRVFLKIY